ncbi:MAG: hypothetical protein EGQ78_04430, partial [Clostridiales bacterium]|nr:hypothetical protein [Clostridiales bacterium]
TTKTQSTENTVQTTQTTQTTTDSATLGEKNALVKAKSYLKMGGFSEESLKNQLEFEGFEESEIDYAVSNCDADWNEQCVDKAESYISMGGFSKSSLHDQLKFEGFTEEQINYALEKVGY